MCRFNFEPRLGRTRMDSVAAHVAHIRHLARPSALQAFLRQEHRMAGKQARKLALQVAPFLDQALVFHDTSRTASLRVRSVLQYYAYLNLAVALILIYQPRGWERYRKHGVEDRTRSLKRVTLSSPVIRVREGALTLFHAIISRGTIPSSPLRLTDLLVPIPMVSAELGHVFDVRPHGLGVIGKVKLMGEAPNQVAASCFSFSIEDLENPGRPESARISFPLRRLYTAIPDLRSHYRPVQTRGSTRNFVSRQTWTVGNRERAEQFHDRMALRFINFGGQAVGDEGQPFYRWYFTDRYLLPTLTAGLLLSFFLASLSRYRANLLEAVETSRINLLCEVFANEADGFMIPAMRNLLYAETMLISQTAAT